MKKVTLLLVVLSCAFGFYGYSQDTCGTAIAVSDGVTNTSTIVDGTAGTEMGYGEDSVFYTYTAPADGAITVSSCFGGSDTVLFVGTGSCGSLTVVASNDDFCDLGDGSYYASQVSNVPVTMGVTYYIEWDDSYGDGIPFDWTLTFGDFVPPPPNDDCLGAEVITSLPYNFSQTGTELGTNNDGFIVACAGIGVGSINDGFWFTFTPATDGTVDIVMSNVAAIFDAQMDLYSGSCGAFTCVANVDVAFSGEGEVFIGQAVTAGTQYFINIGHFYDSVDVPEGNFDIQVTGTIELGVNGFESAKAFTYFPNPVKNTLNLKAIANIQNVSIYNMLGQEVLKTAPNTLESNVNMNQLQSGAYFVKVTINDATETIRVIKQ